MMYISSRIIVRLGNYEIQSKARRATSIRMSRIIHGSNFLYPFRLLHRQARAVLLTARKRYQTLKRPNSRRLRTDVRTEGA